MSNPPKITLKKQKSDEEVDISKSKNPGFCSLGKTVESTDPSGFSLASDQSIDTPISFQPEPLRPPLLLCCVCEEGCEDDPVFLTCSHIACTRCVMRDTESKTTGQIHCPQCGTKQRLKPTPQALRLMTGHKQLFDVTEKLRNEMLKVFNDE